MNVLFCASEATPFAASGGLGDVAGSLPKAIRNRKVACRVVLPLYGDMKEEYRSQLTYVTSFNVPLAWRNQHCGLFELSKDGVKYYFLDNEYYFKRVGLYGFYDDGERYAFYARAILEMLSHIDFAPDILHLNDWQTALVPVYLNLYFRHIEKYRNIKTIFTIHNIQYQGKYGTDMIEDTLGISHYNAHLLEYNGCVNFMKSAIECADKITTVSPTYAKEILDPWYSHGLDGLLREKQYKLCGILNGIDVKGYDPETDVAIADNYNASDFVVGKQACKQELQEEFGLEQCNAPVVAMVTRLVGHKGVDLVRHVAQEIVDQGMQLLVLGSGEAEYEKFFRELEARNPGKVGVKIAFIPALARRVYAGADMFLMPSKSEPCGLSQMIALRYGTVPIVRETGGLQDSVKDIGTEHGNGFTFANYNAHDMLHTCIRAKDLYEDADQWNKLVKRALQCDWSWSTSAKSYVALYEETINLW